MAYPIYDSPRQVLQGGNPIGTQAACAPPQPGISTAIKDLVGEVIENSNLADNLRSSLGILQPEQSIQGKDAETTLVQIIVSMTYRLRRTNGDLADMLRHLNS